MTFPELLPGDAFLFRRHRRWQIWKRQWAGAQVLARDTDFEVIHLAILALDEFETAVPIRHLPILYRHAVAAFDQPIPSEKPQWRDTTHAWTELDRWRQRAGLRQASAFDLPLPEAIERILNAWRELATWQSDSPEIYSAFPVPNDQGVFNVIRLILPETDSPTA